MIWGLWAQAWQNIYVYLPVCLFVCLWVYLLAYQKGILPFDSDLYVTSPSQNNPKWSTQRKYVVVTLDNPGSSGDEPVCPVFQGLWTWAKYWLHVCVSAISLLSSFLKTWLLSLITILYMFKLDRAFLWKLILVNKWGLDKRLNNIQLKETHCPCASKQICRSLFMMYVEYMLWSFDRGIGFCAVHNKRETEYHICTKFKFMRMRSNLRMKRTKLQTINTSSATFY